MRLIFLFMTIINHCAVFYEDYANYSMNTYLQKTEQNKLLPGCVINVMTISLWL